MRGRCGLGVVGDFDNPYLTMSYHAEARIAGELMKFTMSGPAIAAPNR